LLSEISLAGQEKDFWKIFQTEGTEWSEYFY
jgi:hypothetical protein